MRATFVWVTLLGGLAAVAAPVPKEDRPPPITDKHLKTSQNNLKQIGIAFHGFNDATGAMPTDITDRKGKALLSWRVAILPYVDEEKLYKEFKLDEQWDSAANKKLIAKMPKIYAPVRVRGKPGETFYQVFTGEGAIFGGKIKKPQLINIRDGTANTGLVYEAGESVIWTKPQDIPFDAKKPVPKLGGLFDGEFNVVCCDGSVHRIKKNPNAVQLLRLIMPDDGQSFDLEKLTNPRS